MNSKSKGARIERKIMALLEGCGYLCCRSAASLGLYDIICWNKEGYKMIQAKANTKAGKAEREAMRANKVPSNASKELWEWPDRAHKPNITIL